LVNDFQNFFNLLKNFLQKKFGNKIFMFNFAVDKSGKISQTNIKKWGKVE